MIRDEQDMLHPDWADKNRVHNWKNYISTEVKEMWDSFTDKQKLAIASMADDQAGDENWE